MSDNIPLFEIPWNVKDLKNVIDSIGRGSYWAKGPYIEQFETKVADYLGVEHAIAVNSGTSALMAALKGVGIAEGDEVIVPSFTQQATVNAVAMVGGTPVFADIERDTYGLDPDDVEDRITGDTEAILPVDVYGSVCKMEQLGELADKNGLYLVEDAAEALGAKRDGRLAATFGDVAALSFCHNKIIPTGEGGMVVTNNDDIADAASLYRSHGREPGNYFGGHKSGRHTAIGGNFRMPDIVAALGCSQMDRIEELIAGRRAAAERMNEAFNSIDGVDPHTFRGRHVYQFYTVTFDESVDRDYVINVLSEHGVFSKVYWDPVVHESEIYQQRNGSQTLPVTADVSKRVLSLPIHPELSIEETERIVSAVKESI
jgi:perosamine synthetase